MLKETHVDEEALKAEITRYRRALYNLKEDCKRRMLFAESDLEKLFLIETISHVAAELDYGKDTNVLTEENRGEYNVKVSEMR